MNFLSLAYISEWRVAILKKFIIRCKGGDKIVRHKGKTLHMALVKSIFTYNCGTRALTQTGEAKLDALHGKQLKQILNIKHPLKITNKSV